ncbi:MAG: MFS transporter [Acidimicrobiia bacterium]|nr:MFS transporter [Acidimicrobiia bacterium]
MTPQNSSGRASVLEILRAPSVGAYIAANVLLYVGLSLQVTTLAKQVYDITRRELDLGWLGLAEFLPIALLVFVTGTVADRYNRKRVSQLAMMGELASALLLAWYASTEPTGVFPIFMIAILYGGSRAFLAPSMRPIAANIAPEGRLPQMIAARPPASERAVWRCSWRYARCAAMWASGCSSRLACSESAPSCSV